VARRTDWEDALVSASVADGVVQKQELLSRHSRSETGGWTLTRLLIHLFVVPAVVSEGTLGDQRVGLGIGVAEGDAFDAGSLPEVLTAADHPMRDWVWRDSMYVRNTGTSGGNVIISEVRADVRSQRKIDGGVPYLLIENAVLNATAFSVRVTGIIRGLYLLP